MPEGPEVETIRRTLADRVQRQQIDSIWRSAFALRSDTNSQDFHFLEGDRIETLSRVGKLLLLETDRARGIFVRFGMSGRLFYPNAGAPLENHTHLRIHFRNSDFELRYIDPRRFGDVKPFQNASEKENMLASLGPDGIFINASEIKSVAARIQQSERPIKAVLLDQSVISGIGNIYACEALHIAKVSPLKKASALSQKSIERVLFASKNVMTTAVSNKGTTFLSYLDGNGEKGANQNHLRVFSRENQLCPECSQTIIRIAQSGRSTFYCPQCQK